MAGENGTGSGGGNSSVWWQVRHGSSGRPQSLTMAGAAAASSAATAQSGGGRPGSGEIKLSTVPNSHSLLEIHDRTALDQIGRSAAGSNDHPGMFRVRLRIRKQEIDELKKNADPARRAKLDAYWAALPGIARTLRELTGNPPVADGETLPDGDVFLVIDVPAIERKPGNGEPWPHMPWEIHWEW